LIVINYRSGSHLLNAEGRSLAVAGADALPALNANEPQHARLVVI
jgi:hypothetical protein